MYQCILIVIFISSISQATAKLNFKEKTPTNVNTINQIYTESMKTKSMFYNSKFDKKNFKLKVETYSKSLKTSLKSIQNLESKNNTSTTDPIALQLALEIELLEPIQNLANSNLNEKSCHAARHLNKYDNNNNTMDFNLVESVIKQLCNSSINQ